MSRGAGRAHEKKAEEEEEELGRRYASATLVNPVIKKESSTRWHTFLSEAGAGTASGTVEQRMTAEERPRRSIVPEIHGAIGCQRMDDERCVGDSSPRKSTGEWICRRLMAWLRGFV